MVNKLNINEELERFREIWKLRPSAAQEMHHTKELWDAQADLWAEELRGERFRKMTERRVQASARFLREKGLLGADCEVIDLGCGPGRFVTEFARTARHVTGADLSTQMLLHGREYAEECGVGEKTSWVECDFGKADIKKLGWEKRFDLVFTSITPAIDGLDALEKISRMSRGFCFNSAVVESRDTLEEELYRYLMGNPPDRGFESHQHWFYALCNLLFLTGRFPITEYYRAEEEYTPKATAETADRLTEFLMKKYGKSPTWDREKILRFLRSKEENGTSRRITVYGFILWDERETDRTITGL